MANVWEDLEKLGVVLEFLDQVNVSGKVRMDLVLNLIVGVENRIEELNAEQANHSVDVGDSLEP